MSNYTDTLNRGDQIGCYQIQEVLGRGGFAVTYLATDINLDVDVAIKEYLPREITQRDENLHVSARKQEFAEDYEVGLQNFAREAKTLARFKHPHIVRVHQVLHANSTAYMVMDFERGQELAEIFEQHHTLQEDELRAILFPIMDAVEEIHRHQFVHRDIKPSNIYIRENGSPVLIDFGAARYTMSETTQQLTAVVTVGYTPIEQYNVSEDAQGPWSDIYALAAVCYEAVTGEVPSDSVTRASASVTNGNDPLPSVRSMAKRPYSDDCLDAIDWGLRMEADDRPRVIAQWRDAFDGIFNPASAYVEQKDVSIYSPHRVDKPVRASEPTRLANTEDIASIPLNQASSAVETGVISINRDTVSNDSSVTHGAMPPVPPRAPEPQANNDTKNQFQNNNSRNDNNRNVLRPAGNQEPGRGGIESQSSQKRKRSKLERPEGLTHEPTPEKKRTLDTLRDEIEFNDTDWHYEPPQKSSAWKLAIPALALASVVGASVMFVNNPSLLSNLVSNRGPEMTTTQALGIAKEKMDQSSFMQPSGESALDYYQLILTDDPNNELAADGIVAVEDAVKAQISRHVEEDNLSEANRLLAMANKKGLRIYGLPEARPRSETPAQPEIETNESTFVKPIDNTPITPQRSEPTTPTQPEPDTTTPPVNISEIENNVSPFITDTITEIESLIEQERFADARELYDEMEKYFPDANLSRRLDTAIEEGENKTVVPASSNTPVVNTTPDPVADADIVASNTTTTEPAFVEQPAPADPPRNSFIDATGSSADHLNQLRIAIENKDMATVTSISQDLKVGRIQFLERMFQRYDRLDVTIDSVNDSGSSVSAKLNVSMFNRSDDGGFYSAGKWNGVSLNASRSDDTWQKIRW